MVAPLWLRDRQSERVFLLISRRDGAVGTVPCRESITP